MWKSHTAATSPGSFTSADISPHGGSRKLKTTTQGLQWLQRWRATSRTRNIEGKTQRHACASETSSLTSGTSRLHMVAERQQQLHRYSHQRRSGTSHKDLTPREETMTSPSHLGKQRSYNIGALQHHYDRRTSCDLEDDIKEQEDILATCLHLYDVDIKDEKRYMLNLPQPRLLTPAVFRRYYTYIPRVGSWTSSIPQHQSVWAHHPFGLRLQCRGPTYNRHHGAADTSRTSTTRRDPTSWSAARRDNNVIDNEIRQVNQDLNAQQALQDATTEGVRWAGELPGYLIMQATKRNSEPNNRLCRLQRTNIGWEMYRQLRRQYHPRENYFQTNSENIFQVM